MAVKNIKDFVLAGERSGAGKTILTLVMAKAFIQRWMKVQCFKAGPDFRGYPELHALSLSSNEKMLEDMLLFCQAGYPVYAECGGFLYLLQAITDRNGRRFCMTGFFPAEGKMRSHLHRLGYVEVESINSSPFIADGEKMRGHEFHYSDITELPMDIDRCFRVRRRRGRESFLEGYRINNVLAGYLHLHFASNPGFAENFVVRCQEFQSANRISHLDKTRMVR